MSNCCCYYCVVVVVVYITEGLDFNLTDPTTVLTFSPGTDTLDYTFLVLRDDLFEDDEVLSFQLEPAAGETAVVVTGPTQVVILDSDGEITVVCMLYLGHLLAGTFLAT